MGSTLVEEVLGAHTDVETAHHVPPAGGGGDVTAHNAAADSHEDIREAVGDRVTQDTVEETAQRLIDGAGHASQRRPGAGWGAHRHQPPKTW